MHEFACVQLHNTLMGREDIFKETTLEVFNTKDKKYWNPPVMVSKNHIEILGKNDINNREDLADLSVDELLEMIELSKEDAGKIIMDAREPWFNQD